MKTTTITCDIKDCGEALSTDITKNIQTIFKTGRRFGKPLLQLKLVNIHICEKCLSKRLSGESIYADEDMGHNEYYFKK